MLTGPESRNTMDTPRQGAVHSEICFRRITKPMQQANMTPTYDVALPPNLSMLGPCHLRTLHFNRLACVG
jgi:hypothetical protein